MWTKKQKYLHPPPSFSVRIYSPRKIYKINTYVDFMNPKPEPALDIDPAVFKSFQPF